MALDDSGGGRGRAKVFHAALSVRPMEGKCLGSHIGERVCKVPGFLEKGGGWMGAASRGLRS